MEHLKLDLSSNWRHRLGRWRRCLQKLDSSEKIWSNNSNSKDFKLNRNHLVYQTSSRFQPSCIKETLLHRRGHFVTFWWCFLLRPSRIWWSRVSFVIPFHFLACLMVQQSSVVEPIRESHNHLQTTAPWHPSITLFAVSRLRYDP
jgi:hypothetical protein